MTTSFCPWVVEGQYRLFRCFMATMIGLLLWLCLPVGAQAAPVIGVVYPDVREPYHSIFSTIIEGIGTELKLPQKHYQLQEQDSPTALYEWVEKEQIALVISLGKHSQHIIEAMPLKVPVVYGALAAVSNSEVKKGPGILLIPSPEMLFSRLKAYAPDMGTVLVVYNAEHNQWLIDNAREVAGELGMHLEAIPASNIREAAKIWHQAILNREGKQYALWILQDRSVVDDRVILSMILKESWSRNIVAFSSNPAHVKRGVLFSLYPNNFNMGRSLGRLALQQFQNGSFSAGLVPTIDVKEAFNTRTADHLRIDLTEDKLINIDLVFPRP